jgi:hypothetical protein
VTGTAAAVARVLTEPCPQCASDPPGALVVRSGPAPAFEARVWCVVCQRDVTEVEDGFDFGA